VGQQFANCKKNHVIDSCELAGQLKLTPCFTTEWLSDVLKQSVIVIESRTIETFGLLISKVAPEFQEERVKIVDFSVSKVYKRHFDHIFLHSSFIHVFIKL